MAFSPCHKNKKTRKALIVFPRRKKNHQVQYFFTPREHFLELKVSCSVSEYLERAFIQLLFLLLSVDRVIKGKHRVSSWFLAKLILTCPFHDYMPIAPYGECYNSFRTLLSLPSTKFYIVSIILPDSFQYLIPVLNLNDIAEG